MYNENFFILQTQNKKNIYYKKKYIHLLINYTYFQYN